MTERTFDALPDPADFRDRLFEPTLIEVPQVRPLDEYKSVDVPILDQGSEGACTGFGLATVANYLLRTRRIHRDDVAVSMRMLYEMARRYDEWEGEDYEGSSARGAMKGWHKHGVCSAQVAPYSPGQQHWELTEPRAEEARGRPLGAYYRVNHKDIVAMHAAIAEVGVLYVTATVHSGWHGVQQDGYIRQDQQILGGHAFAIVGYDRQGFWLQNSWGANWANGGCAHLTYDDWLANARDVWVARLGVPVDLKTASGVASTFAATAESSKSYGIGEVRNHIVSIGNDGHLRKKGAHGNSQADLVRLFRKTIPNAIQGWKRPRILLYAHGGLVSESSAIDRVMEYREILLENEVYPVGFIWKTDYWTTLKNVLKDALRRRKSEGLLDAAKDFMLDRLDDMLEPIARRATGKLVWDEMKENATLASESGRGVYETAKQLHHLCKQVTGVEVHLVGHSAGSILLGPFIQLLTGKTKTLALPANAKPIRTCTLWAPACTMQFFHDHYASVISRGQIRDFTLYTLSDEAEQDDHCAHIYNKSLLYLVSNAFEERTRIPIFRSDGEPILGMQKFVDEDKRLQKLLSNKRCDWVVAPNSHGDGSKYGSGARSHGAFDDDNDTVLSTLKRILGSSPVAEELNFAAGKARLARVRQNLSE